MGCGRKLIYKWIPQVRPRAVASDFRVLPQLISHVRYRSALAPSASWKPVDVGTFAIALPGEVKAGDLKSLGGLVLIGKAAVLKTAARKRLQVRVLCPPLELS